MNDLITKGKEKINGKVKYRYDGRASVEVWYQGRLIDAAPLNQYEIEMLRQIKHRGVINRSTAGRILGNNYLDIIEMALTRC